jgi:DNA-binding transcriptional regulator YdaS (Cro superfamily)
MGRNEQLLTGHQLLFIVSGMKKPLERAVEVVGSQAALAKKLGVTPQHVWNWLNRDERVPAEQVLGIERATIDVTTGEPRVTRFDLRPDLYPPDERVAA